MTTSQPPHKTHHRRHTKTTPERPTILRSTTRNIFTARALRTKLGIYRHSSTREWEKKPSPHYLAAVNTSRAWKRSREMPRRGACGKNSVARRNLKGRTKTRCYFFLPPLITREQVLLIPGCAMLLFWWISHGYSLLNYIRLSGCFVGGLMEIFFQSWG